MRLASSSLLTSAMAGVANRRSSRTVAVSVLRPSGMIRYDSFSSSPQHGSSISVQARLKIE